MDASDAATKAAVATVIGMRDQWRKEKAELLEQIGPAVTYYLNESGGIDGASFVEWWHHMGRPRRVVFKSELEARDD